MPNLQEIQAHDPDQTIRPGALQRALHEYLRTSSDYCRKLEAYLLGRPNASPARRILAEERDTIDECRQGLVYGG